MTGTLGVRLDGYFYFPGLDTNVRTLKFDWYDQFFFFFIRGCDGSVLKGSGWWFWGGGAGVVG
jgi:hypothetical protein